MHITDWLEMLGKHFPLVAIGCAEALLAVVLLCAALRQGYAAAGRAFAGKSSAQEQRNHAECTHRTGKVGLSAWLYRRKI